MTPTLHISPRAFGLAAFAVPLCASPALAASAGLTIAPDWRELLWLLGIFALLIWPAQRLVFAPLLAVLEKREAEMAGARERAREIFARGDEVMADYESKTDAARRHADAAREEQLGEARGTHAQKREAARVAAEQRAQEVRAAVAAASEEARRELRAQGDALGLEVAARVLGRPLS